MNSATIKLFFLQVTRRACERRRISNWTGKAIAAPRPGLDELLPTRGTRQGEHYILTGTDPFPVPHLHTSAKRKLSGNSSSSTELRSFGFPPLFLSAKTRILQRRMSDTLKADYSPKPSVGRVHPGAEQCRWIKTSESDRHDMDVFLSYIRQLLPVLGSDLLIPIAQPAAKQQSGGVLVCRMKGAEGRGHRTPDGFVVSRDQPLCYRSVESAKNWPSVIALQKQMIANGSLIQKDGFYVFTKDAAFSSPSAAAAVVEGGSANGLVE